jgi:hypothetical protein
VTLVDANPNQTTMTTPAFRDTPSSSGLDQIPANHTHYEESNSPQWCQPLLSYCWATVVGLYTYKWVMITEHFFDYFRFPLCKLFLLVVLALAILTCREFVACSLPYAHSFPCNCYIHRVSQPCMIQSNYICELFLCLVRLHGCRLVLLDWTCIRGFQPISI